MVQLRIIASAALLSIFLAASGANLALADNPLSLADLQVFASNESTVDPKTRQEIAAKIEAETGLVAARPLSKSEKQKRLRAFNNGKAAKYSVQELLDAGVFKFKPIVNLHPNASSNDDDKSVRTRDGKALEIDNTVWGKENVPSVLSYGVMHSTEDGEAGAAGTIDIWNKDCSEGKRSSSTPFVVGRCLDGQEIYVTADYQTRWQRHCSSKLTGIKPVVNWNSIGIEMEHSTEKKIDYTDAQYKAVARLWTYIQERSQIPDEKIITHAELQGHLPKDHKSFRSDPEGFDWPKYARETIALRKKCGFSPKSSENISNSKLTFQKALEEAKTRGKKQL